MTEQRFSLGVVLLAAGLSARMGRPKMLLPWGKTTVLGHQIGNWQAAATAQIAVVIAAEDKGIGTELDRVNCSRENRIVNPDPGRGMFSSIQCAAQWNGWRDELTHWAIALGDQPHLNPSTLALLIERSAENPGNICQPAFRGSGRHPVFLPKDIFEMLSSSKGPTLRDFLQSTVERIKLIEVSDSGIDLDIDRPADYERALRLGNSTSA